MKEETVEMIEIWSPNEKGGEAISFPSGKKLKQVAVIVNGIPIKLDKDWVMERRDISKEVADNLIIKSRPSPRGGNSMKPHEHTYIPEQIAEECSVCGLLKSTIDSMNKTSDQVWDKALSPMIEEMDAKDLLLEYTEDDAQKNNEEIVAKINEIIKALSHLQRRITLTRK